MRILLALVILAPLLSGCLSQTTGDDEDSSYAIDPLQPGPFPFDVLDYDFGRETISDSQGRPWPFAIRGSIHIPDAPGRLPVVVHVHGFANVCYILGPGTPLGYEACPRDTPAAHRVESFRGYDYITDVLAPHGFIVLSVDAGENQGYTEARCRLQIVRAEAGLEGDECAGEHLLRARLVLRTLDHLRLADAGEGPLADQLAGRVDLSQIGLQGHSRGGTAISLAQEENIQRPADSRFGIRALVGLGTGGTHFLPPKDAAYLTIAEYCAGFPSIGAPSTFDNVRFQAGPEPKYQWVVMGANHNFHNTEWAYNDDGASKTDPHCGAFAPTGGRLEAEDQQRIAASIISLFFRAHVTEEAELVPYLSGQQPLPPEACPAYTPDCGGLAHASFHPGAPDRLVIDTTLDASSLSMNALGGASRFDGDAWWCIPLEDCPDAPLVHGRAPRLVIAWEDPSAAWHTAIPAEAGDWAVFDWISVRASITHDEKNKGVDRHDLRFTIIDAQGRAASVSAADHTGALFYPPGEENARGILNEVRVPLGAFEGTDLANVREVALESMAPRGEVLLTDWLVGR